MSNIIIVRVIITKEDLRFSIKSIETDENFAGIYNALSKATVNCRVDIIVNSPT